ncbi:MAG TPA: 2-C-methyl-D-erythritol 2,4-cyclodiphosphate synthase [Firmicutes bacterium]|nr:2-C-methyl-D-erythritol 2,4-cyclodiphosphate synthase [Bacillota bacterium]HBX25143.1 2-C-methyl-D-erythritol 2,4-cyclodiphosphate synthase [Bacillota bacterium]
MSKFKIGYGEDIHRLVKGRKLFLGGIEIESELGLLGHSDADVVIHALMDSLLGASGKGDIGVYFPPDDPAFENADSKQLLRQIVSLIKNDGYEIGNVDIAITAEKPKLKSYIPLMINCLSSILCIDASDINIQAMTNEGLDSLGESKAIRAVAICLLERTNNE